MSKDVCGGISPWHGPLRIIRDGMELSRLIKKGEGDSERANELKKTVGVRTRPKYCGPERMG
jgi:hypothetical protein